MGGTNTAVQIARKEEIPEYNLYLPEVLDSIQAALLAKDDDFFNVLDSRS